MKVLFFLFIVMLSLDLVLGKTQYVKSRREEPQTKQGNLRFSTLLSTEQYIDKSLLVNEFFENRDDYIIYVTAPSAFGKSVNIEMLKSYLEIQVDKNGIEVTNKSTTSNFELFTGLKIFQQHPQLFNWTFGLYPVVSIDYQILSTAASYEDMVGAMKLILGNTFKNHEYLTRVDDLWGFSFDIDTFIEYLDKDKYRKLSEIKIKTGFLYLCKILFTYFKRKVVVLIDQYDSFVHSIVLGRNTAGKAFNLFQYINGDLFMGGRNYIQRIFCTGTLQVVFGGLSPVDQELQCYPFLHQHKWNAFFGLTSEEMETLLEEKYDPQCGFDVKNKKDHIRKYYGGYKVIGNSIEIYKIQPVIDCASDKKCDAVLNNNATDSVYDFLSSVLKYKKVKKCFIKLLQDEEISIKNDLSFSENDLVIVQQIYNSKEYKISLKRFVVMLKYLLQIGILTYKNHSESEYVLSLPNSEVKLKLSSLLHKCAKDQYKFSESNLEMFITNFNSISKKNCKIKDFNSFINSFNALIVNSSFSCKKEDDFRIALASIMLKYKFKDNVILEFKFENFGDKIEYVRIINKNNVSFVIGNIVLKEMLTSNIIRNSTKNIVETIKQIEITKHPLSSRKGFVYVGVCLTINNKSKRNKIRKVSFSYTRKFKARDNINITKYLI